MALSRVELQSTLHIAAQADSAAQPSGWRDEDFITTLHCTGSLLAVAGQQHVAIFRANGPLAERDSSSQAAAHVVTLCGAGERVTAATWAAFDGDEDHSCLVVGTSTGWLQLHAVGGKLLCRQQLHDSAVLKLQLRTGGMGVDPEDASADVTVMFADAAARISGLEIRSLVRLQLISWTAPQRLEPLCFVKWDLQKVAGSRTDGICIGMRPPTLQTLMKGAALAPKLTIATAGTRPPFASFEMEEQTSKGAIAMVTDLASSLRGWIPSPMRRAKEVKLQPAEPATVGVELQDDSTRTLTSLQLAPRGPLAAATDTLGRVMLIDLASMAIVRLLKGYREAQCGWMVLPPQQPTPGEPIPASGDSPPVDATPPASKRAKQEARGVRRDPEVHLVIYAPRRGVCDIYASRHGHPICSLQCGRNGRLLQPAPNMSPGVDLKEGGGDSDCLMLDFDNGSLWSLRKMLHGGRYK